MVQSPWEKRASVSGFSPFLHLFLLLSPISFRLVCKRVCEPWSEEAGLCSVLLSLSFALGVH